MNDDRFIEVVFPDEELPSDELHQIKVLDVPVLSASDRDRIEELIAKVAGLIDSPIGDKINYVLDEMENLKRESEALRSTVRSEETNYRLEEVSGQIENFMRAFENLSVSLNRIQTLPERLDLSLAAEMADEIKSSRVYIENAVSRIDVISSSISNARKEISDAKDALAVGEQTERKVLEKIDSASGRLAESAEAAASAIQDILQSLEGNEKRMLSAEKQFKESAESFEQGLKIIDDGVYSMSSITGKIDASVQALESSAAGVDAAIQKLNETESLLRLSADDFKSRNFATEERLAALAGSAEEKYAELEAAAGELRQLRDEISRKGAHLDDIAKGVERVRIASESGLDDMLSLKESMESALTAIKSYSDSIGTSVSSSERSASQLRSAAGFMEEAAARMAGSQQSFVHSTEALKGAQSEFEKNTLSASAKLDSAVRSLDSRTDDILNVMLSKANEFGALLNRVSDSTKKSEELQEDLEAFAAVSGGYVKSVGEASKSLAALKNEIGDVAATMKKSSSSLEKASSHIEKRDISEKDLLAEIRKLNAHLAKYDDVETVTRIAQAKKRAKKVPKWLTAKRKSIDKSIREIEEEMADILILTSLRKMKMSITGLKEATGMGEARLRKRLKKLTAENRVVKERMGRYFVYALK